MGRSGALLSGVRLMDVIAIGLCDLLAAIYLG
jgi:hypothetical protein